MKIKIILNQQTPEIEPVTGDLKEYIAKNTEKLKAFLDFAKTISTAVGLAANQVSIDDERFMFRCFAIKNIMGDGTWKLIFDPVITDYYGIKILKSEGCLTWPHKKIISERNRFVKVTYHTIDENFDVLTKIENEEHKGFEAQIWQHEINHLNGFEERIESSNFSLNVKQPQRNDKCPCNSGIKYKNCCYDYVNPTRMLRE